ncbi:MAG: RNA-dependent DNA polymerase, partial [Beijerinckiaceae bacterium]
EKTCVLATSAPAVFLGFELLANGGRRLPEENVRRFRNRLRGLRDQWRAGSIARGDVETRIEAWVAHASFADTWRLRHAIFEGGWFDPAQAFGA